MSAVVDVSELLSDLSKLLVLLQFCTVCVYSNNIIRMLQHLLALVPLPQEDCRVIIKAKASCEIPVPWLT